MSNETARQTREQERAGNAWDVINGLDGKPKDFKDQYGTVVRKLPAMIQTNGLGSALAFVRAKGGGTPDKAQAQLYRHVSTWVMRTLGESQSDLLPWILVHDSARYRQATTEAIAYSIWLRRFVEGMGWGEQEVAEEG